MWFVLVLTLTAPSVSCINPEVVDLLTPLKDYNEGCAYDGCPIPMSVNGINVHIVPHTHYELGYQRTFYDHYTGKDSTGGKPKNEVNMKRTLDYVVTELTSHTHRRFTISDLPYFFHWWRNRDESVHRMVYALLRTGRLNFAGGGWGMNDEASTSYHAIIDSYTYSLRKMNATFLSCGLPLVAWQADVMGHSREFASLAAQMGFDGLFVNPISFDDELARMRRWALEMLWRGSDDLGPRSDIFTHKLFDGYWSPPGFCFGTFCNDPLLITSDSVLTNADERAGKFIDMIYNRQAPNYNTSHVLVMMGKSMGYFDAPIWFGNIDALITAVNTKASGINNKKSMYLMYSSPHCYLKEVNKYNPPLETKQDDFFPVAFDKNSYLTGHFTSCPSLKLMAREGLVYLQMSKQLQFLARLAENDKKFEDFNWILGAFQDHVIITGHSTDAVKRFYAEKMYVAIQRSTVILRRAWNYLRQSPSSTVYYRCSFNVSRCHNLQGQYYFLQIYNPLAWPVTIPVRMPVQDVGGDFTVYDPKGNEVESAFIRIPDPVMKIKNRNSVADYEVVFIAEDIPPIGYRSYFLERSVYPALSPARWRTKRTVTETPDRTNTETTKTTTTELKTVDIQEPKTPIIEKLKEAVTEEIGMFKDTTGTSNPDEFLRGVTGRLDKSAANRPDSVITEDPYEATTQITEKAAKIGPVINKTENPISIDLMADKTETTIMDKPETSLTETSIRKIADKNDMFTTAKSENYTETPGITITERSGTAVTDATIKANTDRPKRTIIKNLKMKNNKKYLIRQANPMIEDETLLNDLDDDIDEVSSTTPSSKFFSNSVTVTPDDELIIELADEEITTPKGVTEPMKKTVSKKLEDVPKPTLTTRRMWEKVFLGNLSTTEEVTTITATTTEKAATTLRHRTTTVEEEEATEVNTVKHDSNTTTSNTTTSSSNGTTTTSSSNGTTSTSSSNGTTTTSSSNGTTTTSSSSGTTTTSGTTSTIGTTATSNATSDSFMQKTNQPPKPRRRMFNQQKKEMFIENKYIRVDIDPVTRNISQVRLSNGVRVNLDIQFYYYASDDPDVMGNGKKRPGSLLFRALDNKPIPILDFLSVDIVKTPIVEEARCAYADWASLVLRVYAESPVLEVDWLVGPVPVDDYLGKEVFIRYMTNLVNDGAYFTDSNGRQTIKRIRNLRAMYESLNHDPVAGNYYPVTSKIYIRDPYKNIRFSVFTDRAQGGASLYDGELDLMLLRRVLTSDSPVGTFVNDTEHGQGVTVRGKHYLYLTKDDYNPNKVFEKKFAKEIELGPQVLVSAPDPYANQSKTIWTKHTNEFSFLKTRLPIGVHILTIEKWNDDTLLLRLENYLEKSDMRKNGTKTVFIKELFTNITINKAEETTLAAHIWLKDRKPLRWQKKERFVKSFNSFYGRVIEDLVNEYTDNESKNNMFLDDNDEYKYEEVDIDKGITLTPQQIRTFVCMYENLEDFEDY